MRGDLDGGLEALAEAWPSPRNAANCQPSLSLPVLFLSCRRSAFGMPCASGMHLPLEPMSACNTIL